MSDARIPSSLGRFVQSGPTAEGDIKALAERAWQENGTIVLLPSQVVNWRDRAVIEAVATRLYGKRRVNGGK